jgi:DNA-binding transcriptional MerR regulator
MKTMPEHYSTIGEVLALLLEEFPDVTISKIRFLESQGLISPERTSAGYRKFTEPEVERLRFILREQKDNFLPLRVIRDRLEGETSDSLLRPDDTTDSSMPRGVRAPSVAHPASRRTETGAMSLTNDAPTRNGAADDGARRGARGAGARGKPERLTKSDILEATGVAPALLAELEKMKFVRPQMLGTEPYYDATDRDIVHLASRLSSLGVPPRALMAWRLAAMREADVFEPLVKSAKAARGNDAVREDSHQSAMNLLDELIALGEDLRTALLRSATKEIREHRQH